MACNPLQVQLEQFKEAERLAKTKQAAGRVINQDDKLVKEEVKDSGS